MVNLIKKRVRLNIKIDITQYCTNKYYTVLYRTVVEYEKKNRSLVVSGSDLYITCILLELLAKIKKILRFAMW